MRDPNKSFIDNFIYLSFVKNIDFNQEKSNFFRKPIFLNLKCVNLTLFINNRL